MISWMIVAQLAISLLVVTIVHELGHMLVAQRLGIPVKRITWGFGPTLWRRSWGQDSELVVRALPTGMSVGVPMRRTSDGRAIRPIEHDILLAAGGPLASLLFALALSASLLLFADSAPLQLWLISTALLSALLAILNLIPVPGLDGGHLLLLVAARFGWELKPHQEIKAHRLGMRLTLLLCLGLTAAVAVRWL